MVWVFAIIVVLLLGAVAAVAAGRGRPELSETYDDRADSWVRREGPLSAEDLRAVRFTTAFRGYRMAEVDTLLNRLQRELEEARSAGEERHSSRED